jgi:hypothetical protein
MIESMRMGMRAHTLGVIPSPFPEASTYARARARVLMQTWSDDNQGHAGGIYVFIYNLQYLTGIRTARGRKLPILN